MFKFPTVSFWSRYYFLLRFFNHHSLLMKKIKIQNDFATEIIKEKKKSKIDILTQENELLVQSLKKPG